MKLRPENKKKLNAVKKSLLLGFPISSLIVSGCANAVANSGSPNGNEPAKQNVQVEKTFSIDTVSLFHMQSRTVGMFIPPPMIVQAQKYKVREGDTWESLVKNDSTAEAKRLGLEILLRINGIPAEKVWDILDLGKVPDDLKLVPGQEIFVPVNIIIGRYDLDGEYCP